MIKVKISIGWYKNSLKNPSIGSNLSIFNFTNTQDNIFNNKKYYINSKVEDPDYWFILENTVLNDEESVEIANDRVYFLNSETRYEPSYFLKASSEKFLKQFDRVYSPNFINLNSTYNVPPFLMWRLRGDPFNNFYRESDLEYFKRSKPKKEALLSVYCTNKKITEVQKVRLDFVKKLKEIMGDDLHWYGTDNKTKTKAEGIEKYKYHLVLENQLNHNFISEKLYDAFLGNAYPIYAGASNVGDYYNKNSFTSINLNDFNNSVKSVLNCISSNSYEANIENIQDSKISTLDKFNLIKRIDQIIEKNGSLKESIRYRKSIYPKIHFESRSRKAKLTFSINKRIKKISNFLESFYI